jgi:hypothetical protein
VINLPAGMVVSCLLDIAPVLGSPLRHDDDAARICGSPYRTCEVTFAGVAFIVPSPLARPDLGSPDFRDAGDVCSVDDGLSTVRQPDSVAAPLPVAIAAISLDATAQKGWGGQDGPAPPAGHQRRPPWRRAHRPQRGARRAMGARDDVQSCGDDGDSRVLTRAQIGTPACKEAT